MICYVGSPCQDPIASLFRTYMISLSRTFVRDWECRLSVEVGIPLYQIVIRCHFDQLFSQYVSY